MVPVKAAVKPELLTCLFTYYTLTIVFTIEDFGQ